MTLPPRYAPEDLPDAPGVYLFKDAGGRVLYVGKAKRLRERIRNYARPGGDGRVRIPFLEREAVAIDFVVTASEAEAVLLEDALVKRHRPSLNVRLRDDKSFLVVRIDTRAPFPRPETVRARAQAEPEPGVLSFGPYPSAGALRRTLRLLHTVAPLRDCTDAVMRDRTRPCLKHAIGRCAAPCVGLVGPEEYGRLVDRAVSLLRGRTEGLVSEMRARMKAESAALRFERAKAIRDQIAALEATAAATRFSVAAREDRDAIGVHRAGSRACVAVLRFRGRLLAEARPHFFESALPDEELLASFLARLYATADVPAEVALPFEPNDREMTEAWLASRRGGPVELRVPGGGEKKRQTAMASANARHALETAASREAALDKSAEEVAALFGLRKVPETIDAFDVSNLQGSANVASRVRFVRGRPDRRGYRRFRVKGFEGQDDFASMREVVARALRRDLEADDLPDLLLIDGGRGQLAAALAARDDAGAWDVEAVAIAKDRFVPGAGDARVSSGERVFVSPQSDPVPLAEGTPAYRLLARARDEAHRFAVGYHRQLRSRIGSELDAISGVGATRRRALLRRFGSLTALREADLRAIEAVPGIPRAVAAAVYAALRRRGEPSA